MFLSTFVFCFVFQGGGSFLRRTAGSGSVILRIIAFSCFFVFALRFYGSLVFSFHSSVHITISWQKSSEVEWVGSRHQTRVKMNRMSFESFRSESRVAEFRKTELPGHLFMFVTYFYLCSYPQMYWQARSISRILSRIRCILNQI